MTREPKSGCDQDQRLAWMREEFRAARNRRLGKFSQLPVAHPDPDREYPAAVEIVLTAPVPPVHR